VSKKIDKSDIEAKIREIKGEVDGAANTAKPAGMTLGASVFAGAIGLAYVAGQHKARKRKTVVEIKRV
jgi:hypothetical protein